MYVSTYLKIDNYEREFRFISFTMLNKKFSGRPPINFTPQIRQQSMGVTLS